MSRSNLFPLLALFSLMNCMFVYERGASLTIKSKTSRRKNVNWRCQELLLNSTKERRQAAMKRGQKKPHSWNEFLEKCNDSIRARWKIGKRSIRMMKRMWEADLERKTEWGRAKERKRENEWKNSRRKEVALSDTHTCLLCQVLLQLRYHVHIQFKSEQILFRTLTHRNTFVHITHSLN